MPWFRRIAWCFYHRILVLRMGRFQAVVSFLSLGWIQWGLGWGGRTKHHAPRGTCISSQPLNLLSAMQIRYAWLSRMHRLYSSGSNTYVFAACCCRAALLLRHLYLREQDRWSSFGGGDALFSIVIAMGSSNCMFLWAGKASFYMSCYMHHDYRC